MLDRIDPAAAILWGRFSRLPPSEQKQLAHPAARACRLFDRSPAGHFRLIGHATLRGQLINDTGKNTRQLRKQLVLRQAGQTREIVNRLRAERLMQLIRRDRLVLSGPDPRIDRVTMTVLLKALQQAAEAA